MISNNLGNGYCCYLLETETSDPLIRRNVKQMMVNISNIFEDNLNREMSDRFYRSLQDCCKYCNANMFVGTCEVIVVIQLRKNGGESHNNQSRYLVKLEFLN